MVVSNRQCFKLSLMQYYNAGMGLECGMWQQHSRFWAAVYITGCYGRFSWYPTYCEEFSLLSRDLIFFLIIKLVFEIILGAQHHVFHNYSYIIAGSIQSFAPCAWRPKTHYEACKTTPW